MVAFDVCVVSKEDPSPHFEEHIRSLLTVDHLLISHKVPLSAARQELCEKAGTEWFVFIDDDVTIIGDPYTEEARDMMKDGQNGGVEVKGIQGHPSAPRQTRAYTRFSFIRKEAVKGLSMPLMRHNEDLWIDAYLRSRGWKWPMTTGAPIYVHNRRYHPVDAYEVGYWNRGCGRSPFLRSWLGLFSSYPVRILKEKRGRYTFTLLLRQLHYVRGVTRAQLNGYRYEQPGGIR